MQSGRASFSSSFKYGSDPAHNRSGIDIRHASHHHFFNDRTVSGFEKSNLLNGKLNEDPFKQPKLTFIHDLFDR